MITRTRTCAHCVELRRGQLFGRFEWPTLNICQLRLANLEPKNEIRLRANNEQRQRRHYCARWSGLADNHRTLDTANVDPVSDFSERQRSYSHHLQNRTRRPPSL